MPRAFAARRFTDFDADLVRCCSAFAHTPTSPTSFDSRCSATGPEPEAPDNGQAIDAGQAAAPIHRIHHSNERPVGSGSAKIGHAEEPASAAGTALSPYYLSPPHACWRHKLLARQGADVLTQCPSRPPPAKERGKTAHYSPGMPYGSRWYLRKAKLSFRQTARWSLNSYEACDSSVSGLGLRRRDCTQRQRLSHTLCAESTASPMKHALRRKTTRPVLFTRPPPEPARPALQKTQPPPAPAQPSPARQNALRAKKQLRGGDIGIYLPHSSPTP
jgi:hypothetical protein